MTDQDAKKETKQSSRNAPIAKQGQTKGTKFGMDWSKKTQGGTSGGKKV